MGTADTEADHYSDTGFDVIEPPRSVWIACGTTMLAATAPARKRCVHHLAGGGGFFTGSSTRQTPLAWPGAGESNLAIAGASSQYGGLRAPLSG
jgi:hypothetical protein